MAFELDYVYSQGRHEKDVIDNVNLTFNPVTGANYPFSDISRRAYPDYGLISLIARTGWSGYHALQTSVTKRLSNRWQGSATYTLSGLKSAEAPPHSGLNQVPFPVAADYGGDLRGYGGAGSARLRPDGTIVPRNNFTQPPRRRFDLRLQQRIPLPGRASIDGIAEVFNVFNSSNLTISTQESAAQFGLATLGENRTAQLGFRLTF